MREQLTGNSSQIRNVNSMGECRVMKVHVLSNIKPLLWSKINEMYPKGSVSTSHRWEILILSYKYIIKIMVYTNGVAKYLYTSNSLPY